MYKPIVRVEAQTEDGKRRLAASVNGVKAVKRPAPEDFGASAQESSLALP